MRKQESYIIERPLRGALAPWQPYECCRNLNYCIKLQCINIQYFLSEVKQEIMEFFEGYLQGNFGSKVKR